MTPMSDAEGRGERGPQGRSRAALLTLNQGPIVWALHFAGVYGLQSVACTLTRGRLEPIVLGLDWIQLTVLALTAAAVLLIAGLPWLAPWRHLGRSADERELDSFLGVVMALLALLSVFGVIAAGAAALALPSCPALR